MTDDKVYSFQLRHDLCADKQWQKQRVFWLLLPAQPCADHCELHLHRAVAPDLGRSKLRGRGNTATGGLGPENHETPTAELDM